MSIYINKNIFRFDVSIYNIQFVKILQSKQYLNKVKLGQLLRKLLEVIKMEEYLTSSTYIHYKEKFFL
jgi:hypothetical protein